ncbi:putative aspartyl protease [Sphingomonas zeicaulis]|uniref:retroviral-like aspartic protease family protein n=1 Tax=Sphingomonas zeicaulis TaxID=1632740 RepID=UPI003D22AAA1
MRMIPLAALALLAAPAMAQQAPQPQPVQTPQQVAAVETDSTRDITTTDDDDRITVPVSVGGRGPYRFLIDTGAERTVIASEVAATLDLPDSGTVRLHSITGEDRVPTVSLTDLDHGSGLMPHVRAPALPIRFLGADGILGIDSLENKRLTIDFRKQTMTIGDARKRVEQWDDDVIVVRAKRRYGQLILVDAAVDGQKVAVILDTGTQVSVGNLALERRLAGRRTTRAAVPITITSVTGGQLTANYTAIRKIRVGSAILNDMPVAFADLHSFKVLDLIDRPALLLGMDALALFDRVSVDFANKKARFDMPDTGSRPSPGSRMAALGGSKPVR